MNNRNAKFSVGSYKFECMAEEEQVWEWMKEKLKNLIELLQIQT